MTTTETGGVSVSKKTECLELVVVEDLEVLSDNDRRQHHRPGEDSLGKHGFSLQRQESGADCPEVRK